MTPLQENKLALIAAHKAEDWELAKTLSQEKQTLKRKNKTCATCGISINPTASFCFAHSTRNRFYKNSLSSCKK